MIEQSPAIERLGIPAYNWWNETLHGVARSGDTVTVFPQAIAMAANFDRAAIQKMGEISSDEARAIYNELTQKGKFGVKYKGLTFWTPNINIFRDPRWGRGQETYGEDPYLTGQLGMAIVKGLQGNDPKYLKTSACAKHFAVHSGPETERHTIDINISQSDLWNTYLPAFRDLVVDAKVSSVMCAYNRYSGKPCCGSETLMMQILRKQWGFKGYVTSDCGAINDFWVNHKTEPDAKNAAAKAVINGTDLECGEDWSKLLWSYPMLKDAVKEGLIQESKLDESVKRLYMIRFRLGMFDADEKVPFSKIPYSNLNNPVHKQHALDMARQSIVLLKNNKLLPLSKSIKTIAIIGPNADNKNVQLGNYNGIPQEIITARQGIKNKLGGNVKVIYNAGVNYTKLLDGKSIESVAGEASKADVIIFVGGISPQLEGEEGDAGKVPTEGFNGGDRTTIALPNIQTKLMKALKTTGKPVVFVNMSGSAMGMEWEAENVDGILQAWYGGQSAGTAIADVLFGDYNPSGRLPITFYKNDTDLPDFTDYSMANRTYRYFSGKPRFAFGFGLSYSTFRYEKASTEKNVYKSSDIVKLSFSLTNTGKMHGAEVTQVYIKEINAPANRPIKELKGFKKVFLKADETQKVVIELPIKEWSYYNEATQSQEVKTGEYEILLGSASDKIEQKLIVTIN
jgi:beta-glucosidase